VAIWQHRKRVLGIFSPRMHKNSYLRTSGQKSDPAIRCSDIDFLYDRCISTSEWRLLDIFNVFVLLRRMTNLTLTFDHLTLRVFRVQRFSCPTHIPILLSYDYRLLSYEYWISDHISVIWKSLSMRRFTWPLIGGKNSPHFWNPWPQFTYSLCHFQGAIQRRLSHVISKK